MYKLRQAKVHIAVDTRCLQLEPASNTLLVPLEKFGAQDPSESDQIKISMHTLCNIIDVLVKLTEIVSVDVMDLVTPPEQQKYSKTVENVAKILGPFLKKSIAL